jgi:hypothetical protein
MIMIKLLMSLSNLNNDTISRLFKMIHETNTTEEAIMSIKQNYSSYARLELISRQMQMLQNEAKHILMHHEMNLDFKKLACSFKKVPGNYYYVYEKDSSRFLSMIAPDDWHVMPGEFITTLLFDYDYNFYIVKRDEK